MRISNYFELDNGVMTTPKNCSVLSFIFTCLCMCNPLLTDDDNHNNNNNNNNNNYYNNYNSYNNYNNYNNNNNNNNNNKSNFFIKKMI